MVCSDIYKQSSHHLSVIFIILEVFDVDFELAFSPYMWFIHYTNTSLKLTNQAVEEWLG